MNEPYEFDRITMTPGVMGGKPCIRGMRVTVGMIVSEIGAGATIDELLADFPYLEREDIVQALRYSAWREKRAAGNSQAFRRLMELRRPISDLDEEKELAEWREEKFGHGLHNRTN